MLKAIAFKAGLSDSEESSEEFYYDAESTGSPQQPDQGNSAEQPEYDLNGNLTHYKEWDYTYDAQNRLRLAHNNGVLIATFYYDGKNRQIARRINDMIRFSVWDGWELIEEYGSVRAVAYLQGATGVIKSWTHNNTLYYYQDKLGSTTHVANASGALLESFHYDLSGNPAETSAYGVVDLYAGERWIGLLGLYDLRNRFMSPELGRFLQPDPLGQQIAGAKLSAQQKAFYPAGQAPEAFASTELNLYRYCHNDPINHSDPTGLTIVPAKDLADQWKTVKPELMKDPVTREIIKRLEKPDITVELTKTRDRSGATFDKGYRVFWNPTRADRSPDGTRLSPAMTLGHELDHIHEAATKGAVYIANRTTTDSQYTNKEERRVITKGAEASMLKTFYNEKPRSDYNVIPYQVNSPLDR